MEVQTSGQPEMGLIPVKKQHERDFPTEDASGRALYRVHSAVQNENPRTAPGKGFGGE